MNCCFYLAISRQPLATVAAIEFLPVVALAALGARSRRNLAALALAAPGAYLLTGVQLAVEPLGVAFAFANAVLFALYIVLADRVAKHPGLAGIDGLAASMLIAAAVVTPLAGWAAVPVLGDPVALAAGIGVGVSSSVIPYVTDQLALARLARATYALMVSLLPAVAAVIGVVVLTQIPSGAELAGVALVVAGIALHREHAGTYACYRQLNILSIAGEEDGCNDRAARSGRGASAASGRVRSACSTRACSTPRTRSPRPA